MSDLAEFLAALDEDERAASACVLKANAGQGRWASVGMQVRDDLGHLIVKHTWPNEGEHIARHDPKRALAEVESKRRIVAEHDKALAAYDTAYAQEKAEYPLPTGAAARKTNEAFMVLQAWQAALRLLALPYRAGA